MKKFFTKMCLIMTLVSSIGAVNAQIIWPTADTNTIRMSQFADASSIKIVKKDTILNASLNGYKGWITSGMRCDAAPAKIDSTVWAWTADGRGALGSYWGTRPPMGSADTSRGRGAAIFNSDFLDTRGTGAAGVGQSPAGAIVAFPSIPGHKGELWSPVMDARGFNDLTLMFSQTYRHYYSSDSTDCVSSAAVSWSEDGGATWSKPKCIAENDLYLVNEAMPSTSPVAIKLVGSKGTDKFRVKFIFDGNYYYWMVDDVKVGAPINNMRIDPTWVAIAPTAVQRANVDSLRFTADIINNGSATAKNVKMSVDVINSATQATVFTTTRTYGDITSGTLAENGLYPTAFLAPSTVGTYDIRYKITYDSADAFSADDTLRFNGIYNVTDSILRHDRDNGTALFSNGFAPGGGSRPWKIGNYFYFPKGAGSTATRISAYVGDRTSITSNRTYIATLYEWNDTNKNDSVETAERVLIAAGELTLTGVPASSLLNIRLENYIGNGPVYLKNDKAYLAMIELTPPSTATWFMGFDNRPRLSYGAYKLAGKLAGKPRYTGIIDQANAASPWLTRVFGSDENTPKITLIAWPIRINTKDDLPSTYKMNIYPNPVGESLNINIDFPKSEEAVLFRIYDLKGQLIQEKEFMNVQKETINLDVNQLSSGNYLLQVQTLGNQTKTMKFVKAN